MRLNTTI